MSIQLKQATCPLLGRSPLIGCSSGIPSFLLLILCLATSSLVLVTGFNLEQQHAQMHHKHFEGSAEFQAINSYLTTLEPLSTEPSHVTQALSEAIDNIAIVESVGLNRVPRPGGPRLEACIDNLLNTGQPQLSLRLMQQLVVASRSCDQEATNFLRLVVGQQTFEGQFLNKYASQLLKKCSQTNLINSSVSIKRALGKMDSHLFEVIDYIANKVSGLRMKEEHKSRGEIFIMDLQPPGNPKEKIHTLRELNIIGPQLKSFTKALVDWYDDYEDEGGVNASINEEGRSTGLRKFFFGQLAEPCSEAVNRMQEPLSLLMAEQNSVPTQSTGEALESERNTDSELDYLLEISRICRLIDMKKIIIWDAVSRVGGSQN